MPDMRIDRALNFVAVVLVRRTIQDDWIVSRSLSDTKHRVVRPSRYRGGAVESVVAILAQFPLRLLPGFPGTNRKNRNRTRQSRIDDGTLADDPHTTLDNVRPHAKTVPSTNRSNGSGPILFGPRVAH